MKILALTNLFPPHHAGTYDLHCQKVTAALRMSGHEILILTSSHGLRTEQRDNEIHRRFWLNGVYDHPLVTKYLDLKKIELYNHEVLLETIAGYKPHLIHVFGMHGLSKSFVLTLRHVKLPVVYDVHQPWISAGLPQDPWLHFWNAPSLPFLEQSKRAMLEASGERGRLESAAPTRPIGIDRHPIFGDEESRSKVPPGSVSTFHFNRIYFASQSLKKEALNAGFSVGHGEVIYPGISTSTFIGEIKPAKATVTKMLVISDLDEQCGVMTALQALKKLRAAKVAASMSIFGRGATRYMAEVRSFVVTHQLPVEFLNVSNVNTDLPAIYKKHDLFLYTAESQEGFPDAILEAMACGLPVIGAYHRGTEEFLRHGENSFAFTPGDADALAACMQSLQVSPALRCQMAETAQEEVMSQFNESASLEKIENYLNASVEGRGSEA